MTLPKPQSRAEQYLNNLATGTGELPPKPLSRIEMYLDYIAKNGGMSAGDGSGHYHANKEVLDGLSQGHLNATDTIYEHVEGSNISVDTIGGDIVNLEILGNTIQDPNGTGDLSDIRSTGDEVEGQNLYKIPLLCTGKNLFDKNNVLNGKLLMGDTGSTGDSALYFTSDYIKVKANVTYILNVNSTYNGYSALYDKTKKYLKRAINWTPTGVFTPTEDGYIRFSNLKTNLDITQLEEGTKATQYEPYIEDKLTILSPVQLEKVGDIEDRIVEKDVVWGVEKDNIDIVLNENTSINPSQPGEQINALCDRFMTDEILLDDQTVITDKLGYSNGSYDSEGLRAIGTRVYIYINKERYGGVAGQQPNLSKFKAWLKDNNINIKIPAKNPQFIPLPHSQQVKLRTFANKTNIQFLTEVEGTIKADVPKSLGATVNTHTTQIDNLNKELDRVKKLKQATTTTVKTESDFVTVEETNNGYFEDVCLKGRTFVNLMPNTTIEAIGNGTSTSGSRKSLLRALTNNETYTIMFDVSNDSNANDAIISLYSNAGSGAGAIYVGDFSKISGTRCVYKHVTNAIYPIEALGIYIKPTSVEGSKASISNIVILEGDHTQNPPQYFEGLKSVGDDVDEIVVSSCTKVDYIYSNSYGSRNDYTLSNTLLPGCSIINKSNKSIVAQVYSSSTQNWIRDDNISPNETYIIKDGEYCPIITLYTARGWQLKEEKLEKVVNISTQRIDKKRVLYYDTEDNTWKKPTLREMDSIEKHADGKYYYHVRSGEDLLDGSRNWRVIDANPTTTMQFRCDSISGLSVISDKFKTMDLHNTSEDEYCFIRTGDMNIKIKKDKLETQDAEGFKKWLKINPVKVVYQLAQEKVYECTNIDLITYPNTTNYVVKSGVLSPRSELKVHSNISNVVSLLQKKVSTLESSIGSYMVVQNRLQLKSMYSADRVTFRVDTSELTTTKTKEEVDYDVFRLLKGNILVGKDNYDRVEVEEMMDFYVSIGKLDYDMWDELWLLIELQHNPPIEEETPEI